jgi:5-methylcytosine-specific restriction endonuclease McrA
MLEAQDHSEALAVLFTRERDAVADAVESLAEFHRHFRWRELGYESLFTYLTYVHGFNDGAAYLRVKAAELVAWCPAVLDALRSGTLCLSILPTIAKCISPENWEERLPHFFGASKRAAQSIAIALEPKLILEMSDREYIAGFSTEEALPESMVYAYAFNAPQSFKDKLEAAKSALSHRLPDGNTADILEAALDVLLRDVNEKRRPRSNFSGKVTLSESARDAGRVPLGSVHDGGEQQASAAIEHARPARGQSAERSRYVPMDVQRAVWERDGGQCQAKLPDGSPCHSTYQLELDHYPPFALGGESTLEGMRVLCRRHNALAARQVFGDALMNKHARKAVRIPAKR